MVLRIYFPAEAVKVLRTLNHMAFGFKALGPFNVLLFAK